MSTIAFIDGQNLHLGTKPDGWEIDLKRFRIYLKDKYKVVEAYYFIGFISSKNSLLYDDIQRSGYILKFKDHTNSMIGSKKGNVDTDIVFEVLTRIISTISINDEKFLLVSGDGDYFKLVNYLINSSKFIKILFPNKKFASSLYKTLGSEYYDYLNNDSIKKIIQIFRQNKKAP